VKSSREALLFRALRWEYGAAGPRGACSRQVDGWMDGGNESVSGLTRNADSARPFQSVDLRGDPLRRSPPSVRCRPNFTSGAARDPRIFGPGRWSSARSLQQRLKPHTSNPQPSQRLQRPDMEGGMARVPPTDNVTPPRQVSKTKYQYCGLPRSGVPFTLPPVLRSPIEVDALRSTR
jgi:hypothetical protein